MANKRSKKKNNKIRVYSGLILGLLILAVLVYLSFTKFQETKKIAAVVNGEKITYSEIDALYNQLPVEYQGIITKGQILEQKINEMILLQEAAKKDIQVTDAEVEEVIQSVISQSGLTEKDFEERIKQQGVDIAKLKEYYKVQLIILTLLNDTVLENIEVTESDIKVYYYEADLKEAGLSLEDARDEIESLLLAQKREEAFLDYTDKLKTDSDIEIFFGIETFEIDDSEICEEDGKPIIRLFTTSNCEECKWVEDAFESVVTPYIENGDLIAHAWELDTGDDKLTLKKETSIPSKEASLFRETSKSMQVPTFVFGCKYTRIGTGYFKQNDLKSEQIEFDLIINQLLS